jgi:hypothetical protein
MDGEEEGYDKFYNEGELLGNSVNNIIPLQEGKVPQNFVPNSKEESTIFEIEIWKRAEITKFKAYLKQLEYEFLNKISNEYQQKEESREKEFKVKINELNILQTRLKKKAMELEAREGKINLMEEELKIKINEVARQLANKEEEIVYIKKKFKEEKLSIEKEKQILQKTIQDRIQEYEKLELSFKNYKKQIDDSPVSVLKHEINRKSLENEDLIKSIDRLNQDIAKLNNQNERLKIDLLKMKKTFESEKEQMYKQKIDEIEKLKFEIFNQKTSQNEMMELVELRNKIKMMSSGNNIMSNEIGVPTYNSSIQNKNMEVQNQKSQKKEYKIINIRTKSNSALGGNYHSSQNDLKSDIERLYQERESLINSGNYLEGDPLIIQIDNRIRRILEQSN